MARRPRGPDEQTLLGQFYTPPAVAELLVALTLDERADGPPEILDPACGDGALLASAYESLVARGYSHTQVLAALSGFEISQTAADAASAALSARGAGAPKILAGDFFAREPEARFDCIIGNPPYLRSQNQDDLDPAYRERLFAAAARAGVRAHAKTDLFGFFMMHASRFLKIGGRLGFVTPASWLTSEYAASLQGLLTGELRLSAIVSSSVESFFPEVDIHTVLVLADRVDPAIEEPQAALRFVTLRRPLADLTAGGRHEQVQALAREVLGASAPREDGRLRVHVVPLAGERAALAAAPGVDWSRVTAFHMDEYIGLAADAPQRFGRYLRDHIFAKV
ncbi:MAG TPA: N-6 DNA methylase, partial [Nannocystis sp.]